MRDSKDDAPFRELVAIMDRLRGPDGCPWDREQNYASLRGYLIEECHEVADALDREDPQGLCEELGDLLFQIVFLSRLGQEQGRFTIDDVVRGISDKMTRRHPHVFGSATAETAAEVVESWERIKREEKAGSEPRVLLDGVPAGLPALLRAERLGARAARVGFDWTEPRQVLDKIEEELGEVREALDAGDEDGVQAEIGDLLFTVAMLARRLQVEPEAALQRTNVKFAQRFGWVESELKRRGIELDQAGTELMEQLWNQAKTQTT